MEEKTTKKIKKALCFEKSGETYSVEIGLENVSPEVSTDTIISFLDRIFNRAKEELQFDSADFNKFLNEVFGLVWIVK